MSQNSLNSSFLSTVAAFFSFGTEEKSQTESNYRVCAGDPDGLSGVEKYLQSQEALLARQKAEQLEKLSAQAAAIAAQASASGVAKYLAEQPTLTSVERYALRHAIADKQAQKDNPATSGATGVDKYLKGLKPAAVLSGVAKYLKHQESLPQPSKVAKYMAKQALMAKHSKAESDTVRIEATGVARYLQHQASLPQPTKVARYMAKQAALAALHAKPIVAKVKPTGVAKYLQHQDSLPQPSRVAKYLARQALTAQQKVNAETSVEKYVRHQG
ncbi:MAG: hypothetical protein EXR80_06555 [Methylococcales bacterium]|nr:hypothetical protein [Methylococcales bacterium]